MNQEKLNLALRATIDELTTQLSAEMTTKNVLAAQLTEERQINKELTQQNAELSTQASELEALLEEKTKP